MRKYCYSKVDIIDLISLFITGCCYYGHKSRDKYAIFDFLYYI